MTEDLRARAARSERETQADPGPSGLFGAGDTGPSGLFGAGDPGPSGLFGAGDPGPSGLFGAGDTGPQSVVDIGSTDERWAAAFHREGVDVLLVRPPGHPAVTAEDLPVLAHDFSKPLLLDRRFDLAVSIGDPGSLTAGEALNLVAGLCRAADVVAFSRPVPRLVPPGAVSAPAPPRWDTLFEHHGFVAQNPDSPSPAVTPPGLVVYARPGRLSGPLRASATSASPPAATWALLQRQLLDSESRADKGHRDAVLLWAALVATQRQLVAATYRLLRTPTGEWPDSKTLLARAATGALPLRRGLRSLLGPAAPVWDRMWYVSRYPDVATARLSPLWHYRRHGAPTRRSPHPWVDPAWYAAHNPDVVATGADPVEHYFGAGWKEGRDPHPLFDTRWYNAPARPWGTVAEEPPGALSAARGAGSPPTRSSIPRSTAGPIRTWPPLAPIRSSTS